jgi:tetratricopeptide (TPR) repeat protein
MMFGKNRVFAALLLGAFLVSTVAIATEPEKVELSAEQVIELNKARAEGKSLFQKRQYQAAIMSYQRALEIDPNVPTTHYNIGLSYYRLKAYSKSIAAFEKTVALDKGFVLAHVQIAKSLAKQKNVEAAEAKCMEIKTTFADSMKYLGEVDSLLTGSIAREFAKRAQTLGRKRKHTEALAAAQKAVELDPTGFIGHYMCAKSLVRLKRYDEAKASFEAAFANSVGKKKAIAADGIGRIYAQDARTATKKKRHTEARKAQEQAIKYFEFAIEADPKSGPSYLNLGQSLFEMRRYKKAVDALKNAERFDKRRSYKAPLKLADAYLALKSFPEAEKAARRSLVRQRQNPSAHMYLAEALEGQKRLKEAMDEYTHARRDPRWRPRATYKLKKLCEELGNCRKYGIKLD